MAEGRQKPILGKVLIKGTIFCDTGLHIGGSQENLDIGGIDSPVLRDPLTRRPYIPGSSLKGKMRALFERTANKKFNRHSGQEVYRHECSDPACDVCRLFGATGGKAGENLPARLIVRDCKLSDDSEKELRKIDTGLQYTEWKFENALDRVTAAANPRQLERVPAGAEFEFEMVYNVETEDKSEVKEDLSNLLDVMRLVEDDFIGGHGSRGYGKISFVLDKGTFAGRSIAYYAAASDEERAQCSKSPEVQDLADCKAKLDEVLTIF